MGSSPSHTGIMLLAFGGATALEDVEPFLRNIFPGHSLSPSFIREVQERYHLIGGKSPLLEITRRQAWSLQENLNRAGKLIDVAIGMKHWHPSIPETIKSMAAQGITRLFCLILSPFLTRATAEGYRDAVHQSIRDIAPALEAHFVLPWNTHPGYLDAVAQQIKEGLALFPAERRPGVHLVFTCRKQMIPTLIRSKKRYPQSWSVWKITKTFLLSKAGEKELHGSPRM
jgi:ferrochelatase